MWGPCKVNKDFVNFPKKHVKTRKSTWFFIMQVLKCVKSIENIQVGSSELIAPTTLKYPSKMPSNALILKENLKLVGYLLFIRQWLQTFKFS